MNSVKELQKAYSELSDHRFLDELSGKSFDPYMTVFVIMHQINSDPEHIKIEGLFLDEEKAKRISQLFDFAWVDNYRLYL